MKIELHMFKNLPGYSWPLLTLCLCGPVFAQTAADLQEAARKTEQLQRQTQEQIRRDIESATPAERAPTGIDTRSLQPKIDASGVGSGCREIREIVITGAPNLSNAVREHISRTFAGRCLGVQEIEQILGEITLYYVKSGLITTRAYLPQQDLRSGRLEILVLEGKIGKIMIEDGDRKSVARTAFPAGAGELLNLRDLEQGVDQVNKLSSNNARLDIQPGENPGESTVVIHNSPGFPLHASLSADNQGSESTGKNQVGLTVIADGLAGLNELMIFTHRESRPNDIGRKYAGSNSLSLAVPFGYSTLSLSFVRSKYASTFRAPSGLELTASGDSATDSIGLDRVMYRDQATRWSLAGTLSSKSSRNYLADQFLAISSRALTTLDLDSNATTFLMGGVANLGLGYTRGLRLAGALVDPDDLPDFAPRAQFEKFRVTASYSRPFQLRDVNFTFSTVFTGQHASVPLYGSEQIGIGGIASVRGFVNNTLSGDSGYYIRNDIAVHPTLSLGDYKLPVRVFAGYDFGAVKSRAPGVPEGRLSGMAVGVSTAFKGASLEVFNSRPLSAPNFFNLESSRTWIRLAYAI